MIFVTVSKDIFFERRIKKIDDISYRHSLPMVVQGGYEYSPKSDKIRYHSTLRREDFEKYFDEASLVISHAGIGNIIMGKQKSKPIITNLYHQAWDTLKIKILSFIPHPDLQSILSLMNLE